MTRCLLIPALACAAFSQPPTPPAFEVASIKTADPNPQRIGNQSPTVAAQPKAKFDAASVKPCQPGDGPGRGGGKGGGTGFNPNMPEGIGGYFRAEPGRLDVTCASILSMIGMAYVDNGAPLENNPFEPSRAGELVTGLPKWTTSARYTIHAETDGAAQPQRVLYGPMLQSLLEERFHLQLHRETADAPMYALTVAKGGFKLKPMQDGECVKREDGQGISPIGFKDKPYCSWMGMPMNGPNRTVLGGGITLDRLAQALSTRVLNRNVINRTGISGSYIVRLEYFPDDNTHCIGPPQICTADPNSDLLPGAPIFAALEQQLGLKLETIKGPTEHIVVDRVDRPTEN